MQQSRVGRYYDSLLGQRYILRRTFKFTPLELSGHNLVDAADDQPTSIYAAQFVGVKSRHLFRRERDTSGYQQKDGEEDYAFHGFDGLL